jgi:hypothetical protein
MRFPFPKEKEQMPIDQVISQRADKLIRSLPKATSNEIKREIRDIFIALKRQFYEELEAEVSNKLKERRARFRKREKEVEKKIEQAIKLKAGVKAFMTEQEYKLVLGCLHPDRECTPDRKRKAFLIFKRLEDTVG